MQKIMKSSEKKETRSSLRKKGYSHSICVGKIERIFEKAYIVRDEEKNIYMICE